MPTDFDTSFTTNDVVEASHVLQYADPVNNLETGASYYAVDEAGSDDYVVTLDPVPDAYTSGMIVHFLANTANTGSATINANGLGPRNIKKRGTVNLDSGDIAPGQVTCLIFDGTNFQLVSSASVPTNLSDLGDVEITSPTDGQVLMYDAVTNNRWENQDLAATQVSFDDSGLSHITGATVQAALESVDSQLGTGSGGGQTTIFTTSGTYSIPEGATLLEIHCLGAGGGGGGGATYSTGYYGGCGGAGGSMGVSRVRVADLVNASLGVTIGAGGAGAAGKTGNDDAPGDPGSSGGDSYVTDGSTKLCMGYGGAGGGGIYYLPGLPYASLIDVPNPYFLRTTQGSPTTTGAYYYVPGTNANALELPFADRYAGGAGGLLAGAYELVDGSFSFWGAGGGGSGADSHSGGYGSNMGTNGGIGGAGYDPDQTQAEGGAIGSSGDNASAPDYPWWPGSGGGGGGAGMTGNAGDGGDGILGGGGGGGGGATNPYDAGSGGYGGNGMVVIYAW